MNVNKHIWLYIKMNAYFKTKNMYILRVLLGFSMSDSKFRNIASISVPIHKRCPLTGSKLSSFSRSRSMLPQVCVMIRYSNVCVLIRYSNVCVLIRYSNVCVLIRYSNVCVLIRYSNVCVLIQYSNVCV